MQQPFQIMRQILHIIITDKYKIIIIIHNQLILYLLLLLLYMKNYQHSQQQHNKNQKQQKYKQFPYNKAQSFSTHYDLTHKSQFTQILEFKTYNTLLDNHQTDKIFLQKLDKLATIFKNKLNPLIKSIQFISDIKCQYLALAAQRHSKAARPSREDYLSFMNNKRTQKIDQQLSQQQQQKHQLRKNKCNCGCQRTRGQQLPINIQEAQLRFLGSGTVLFFFFIRMMILLAALGVGFFTILGLINSFMGNQFWDDKCQKSRYCSIKLTLSLVNNKLNSQMIVIWQWFGVIMVIIWIIVLRIIKYKAKILDIKVDKGLFTPSDTAIKLENLPYGQCDQQQIRDIFEQKWNKRQKQIIKQGYKLDIKSIQIVYDMRSIRELIQNIGKLAIQLSNKVKLKNKQRIGQLKNCTQQKYLQIKENLKSNLQLLSDLKKKFYNQKIYRRKIATTCVIIQLKSQEFKDHFLNHFGSRRQGLVDSLIQSIKNGIVKILGEKCNFLKINQQKIKIKGKVISIERAPEPQDILWQNCQIRYSRLRIFLIYLISILIILMSLGIVIGLQYIQIKLKAQLNNTNTINIIDYIISFSLMIINQILLISLVILIKYQYNHTTSQEVISQTNKTIITQSVNTIVIPMISNFVIQQHVSGTQGIAGAVFDFSVSNTIVNIALIYFDPIYFAKKFILAIKCIRNKIIRHYAKKITDQQNIIYIKELNIFYEPPDIDMTGSYIYLTVAILHSSFYFSLQPLLMLITLFGFTIFYYTKKHLLLARYTLPKMIQKHVFDTILIAVSAAPLFFGIGSLVLLFQIYGANMKIILPGCISIILSTLNIINPQHLLDTLTSFLYKKYYAKKNRSKITDSSKIIGSNNNLDKTETIVNDKQNSIGSNIRNASIPLPLTTATIQQKNDFKHNLSYYYTNNIGTLLGYKKILSGQDIDQQIRLQIKRFVESFTQYNQIDYPQEENTQQIFERKKNEKIRRGISQIL